MDKNELLLDQTCIKHGDAKIANESILDTTKVIDGFLAQI
jgi:hypothetical protein